MNLLFLQHSSISLQKSTHFSARIAYFCVLCFYFLGTACTPEIEEEKSFENIPPYSPIISLSPSAPQTQDSISASLIFDTTDPDGDPVSLSYVWKKNDIEQTINGDTVLYTQTQKGEVWSLEAYTFDGSLRSSTISVSTTIRNTPPVILFVDTGTETPNANEPIIINDIQSEDADNDSVSVSIDWYQNGLLRTDLRNDRSIPIEHTAKDDIWEAMIIPHDGEDPGEVYTQTFDIQNTPPEITSVQIAPQEAFESSILMADIEAIDADQDLLSFLYSWNVNGLSVSTAETLNGNFFDSGDLITLDVEAFDENQTSPSIRSSSITIQNTPPNISSISISPTEAYTTDSLVCEAIAEADLDQDTTSITYEWFVNNQLITNSTNTFDSSLFQKGDSVLCAATVSDQDSNTMEEVEVIIQNTAPIVQSISLTSPASMLDIIYCEVLSNDDDQDLIIHEYEWFVSGIQINHANSFLDPQNPLLSIEPGDDISCTATPSDGEDSGSTGSSNNTTLLPAYIELEGSLLLRDSPVAGIPVTSNTLSVGTDVSSIEDGTYALSIPTLSGTIISSDIENQTLPQSFTLDIAQGITQNQDITILDTHFPAQTDVYDPDNGYTDFNNFADTMQHSDIVIGEALQYRTLYPAGEEDWIQVSLSTQQTYSFFTSFSHHTSNIVFFIYDAQGTQVASSTTYLGNDNIIEAFSPAQDGEHFIKIDTLESNDVASYVLGAFIHEDADNDGHISWYDCDDLDSTIYPNALDVAQDGIDQNCDGVDSINATALDATEPLGVQYLAPLENQNTHPDNPIYTNSTVYTLHSSADLDRFSISVPAKSKQQIVLQLDVSSIASINILEGNILLDSYTSDEDIILYNSSSIGKTLYIYVQNTITGTPTQYQIKSISYGADNDLDGYYAHDINGIRDDNDANPNIHP